jgi:hypothetical protein
MMDVSNIKLTPEERGKYTLGLSQDEIAALSLAERLKFERAQVENIYGHNVRFKDGQPIEQGIGSAANQSINHTRALEAAKSARTLNEAVLAVARRGAD